MGTVSISGKTFDIYGEHLTDDTGPPLVISASTYFAGSLNASAWNDASLDDQARAQVTAGRIFDKQSWVGAMTDPTTPQPLAWPRTGVPECDGIVADPDEIPERVILGSYEYALAILQDAATQTQTNTGSNVRRVLARKKVGDLEVEDETEYFSATNSGINSATRFPATVQEYISCYVGGQLGGATVVGAAESVFIDWDFGIS
jgi:hypothetical protein